MEGVCALPASEMSRILLIYVGLSLSSWILATP